MTLKGSNSLCYIIHCLSEPITKVWTKIDPHCQRRKCSTRSVVSGNIRLMQIFVGVHWWDGVKMRVQSSNASSLSIAISSVWSSPLPLGVHIIEIYTASHGFLATARLLFLLGPFKIRYGLFSKIRSITFILTYFTVAVGNPTSRQYHSISTIHHNERVVNRIWLPN